jgi:hypothetical protein
MMSILDLEQVPSFLNVIRATEQNVNFLEWNTLCFGNQEEYEYRQADVAGHEEEERFPKIPL